MITNSNFNVMFSYFNQTVFSFSVSILYLLLSNQSFAGQRELSFAVSGVVSSVKVKSGDKIKEGNVIAYLDQTLFQSEKNAADHQYNSAKLVLELSKIRSKQLNDLFDSLSASKEEVEKAEIIEAKALAKYFSAKSRADRAFWRLKRSTLRSPFSGIVISVDGYEGMVINTDNKNPVIVVIDTLR